MFFTFFFLFIRRLSLPLLEQEKLPSFQELDEDNLGTLQNIVINKKYSNTVRVEFDYFMCAVKIDIGTTFQNNFAFGSESSGGALFLSFCSLSLTGSSNSNSNFYKNKASVGGAIAALYSNVMILNSCFKENVGCKYAGALYLQGCYENKEPTHFFWQIKNTDFNGNTGSDIGGAIVTTTGFECYFDGVFFF